MVRVWERPQVVPLIVGYDYPHTAPQSHYYTPEVETRVVLMFKNFNLMNS